MTARTIHTLALAIAAAAACYGTGAMAQVPAAVAAPGETTVATFQGEGAQIYQCKAGNDGKLTWVFREPIANADTRRQDGRAALRRSDLGGRERQRRDWQGDRKCARRDPK